MCTLGQGQPGEQPVASAFKERGGDALAQGGGRKEQQEGSGVQVILSHGQQALDNRMKAENQTDVSDLVGVWLAAIHLERGCP